MCFSSIKVIECYSEIEKHKDSCLQQMRFCLYKARLVAILVNLHFVSFESQPCQSTVSKNSDQQTRGLPASGEQRCVSDHGQLVCVDCFFFDCDDIGIYSWTLLLYVCDRLILYCRGNSMGRCCLRNFREGSGRHPENGVCFTGTFS